MPWRNKDMKRMKVVVDAKIPYIKGVIESLADEVVYAEGKDFTPVLVKDADALFVRTRTRCDRALLEGSSVRFIATATIGYDHIDTVYCREAGITWTNAPGCNAAGVAQYVQSVLLLLEKMGKIKLSESSLGVVGVGHVGSKVVEVGRKLGMKVLPCDPPRAEKEGWDGFYAYHNIIACDVITFHTPLTKDGLYPTWHLVDECFLRGASPLRPPYIINTSRGEVVDNALLSRELYCGLVAGAVLDVWENEPNINRFLLSQSLIATPHIAGYSADGKANATRMALEAYCKFFHITANFNIEPPAPEHPDIYARTEADALLQIYDPRVDSEALKQNPELFEQLRGNYHFRREPQAYTIHLDNGEVLHGDTQI